AFRARPIRGSARRKHRGSGQDGAPSLDFRVGPVNYVALIGAGLLVLYVALSYLVYRRAFVPDRPAFLDDFAFTPFEFQADYEEVELVTADGVSFGDWHFRQPGSPQTVIVSGGHKGQRQGSLGIAAALW